MEGYAKTRIGSINALASSCVKRRNHERRAEAVAKEGSQVLSRGQEILKGHEEQLLSEGAGTCRERIKL